MTNFEDCCPANDTIVFLNQSHFGLYDQGIELAECYLEDESKSLEIREALEELTQGNLFAFYNLHLTKEDNKLLSQIEATTFNNIGLTGTIFAHKEFHQDLINALTKIGIVKLHEISKVSHLITRIVSIMMSELQADSFELVIRTREGYTNNDGCYYWHLDKSENEIFKIPDDGKERRFIIPLKGSGTVYQVITEDQREEFIKVATEAPYYYGHSLTECKADDQITILLNKNEISHQQEGYGSVHIAGIKGAMHAAPKDSNSRLLLLLTPKQK